ncbi:acyltransferase family protein [Kytococcus sp. Marseille-QA3725]
MSAVPPAPPAPGASHHRPKSFRPDVEGLRAIAVLSVLAYHAGLPVITGGFAGVDVFFVLSGFLITGQLLKEVGRTGTVDLPAFYGRRFKRLLPAATMVLLFTAIGTWLLLPLTRFKDVAWDIAYSAVYLINWRLADQSVDYLAEDTEPSPLQHFWSLAVEEQFYVVWPLVLLLVGLVVTRARTPLAPTATVGLLAIAVPSLVWSIVHTVDSPSTAYFVTTTRLWELAIGGLVACGATVWARLSPRVSVLLVAAGLVMLAVAFLLFSSSTPWPGSAALVPTVGTALALVGGYTAGGPLLKALGSAPMLWVGGLSYSLYLWHWPLVIFTQQGIYDGEKAPLWATVAAVLLAFPLAWAGNRLIENPVRFAPPFKRTRNALLLGGSLTLTGALVAGTLLAVTPGKGTDDDAAGAEVLMPAQEGEPGRAGDGVRGVNDVLPATTDGVEFPDSPPTITPDPLKATEDVPPQYEDGCQVEQDASTPHECLLGDTEADRDIALVGDSKAFQWAPAMDRWAKDRGYRIRSNTKSACSFSATLQLNDDKPYPECQKWGDQVAKSLQEDPPEVLVISGLRKNALVKEGGTEATREALVEGYLENLKPLADKGTTIVAIADTPQPGNKVYECVAENPENVSKCDFSAREGVGTPALEETVEQLDGSLIDFNDYLCPDGSCRAVNGGVLTYRQGSHVTTTWVNSLQPVLNARLDAAIERGERDQSGGSAAAEDRAEEKDQPVEGVRDVNEVRGAEVDPAGYPDAPKSITPDPSEATTDVPPQRVAGCHVGLTSAEPRECRLGDPEGRRTVAVVGDSKALQWLPGIDAWAKDHGYSVRSNTKSACAFSAATQAPDGTPYTDCTTWGAEVAASLQDDPPDALVVSGLRSEALVEEGGTKTSRQAMVDGYLEYLEPLAEQGTTIVALADTPQPGRTVHECVAAHRSHVSTCDFPEKPGVGTPVLEEVMAELDGSLVDLNDHLCPEGTCRAVNDGVLTYRQGSHVTNTWVTTMQPVLGDRLDAALEWSSKA